MAAGVEDWVAILQRNLQSVDSRRTDTHTYIKYACVCVEKLTIKVEQSSKRDRKSAGCSCCCWQLLLRTLLAVARFSYFFVASITEVAGKEL